MPVLHDAYVFDPEKFMQFIGPFEQALKQGPEGYARLRTAALALFDRDPRVSFLAATYGTWDRHKLETQWSVDKPKGFYEAAFWAVLLLYGNFTTRPHALGLNAQWGRLEQALMAFGWDADEAMTLVRGHKFLDLARQVRGTNASGLWHYVNPPITTGTIGWLSPKEVQWYKSFLFETKPRFASPPAEMVLAFEQLQESYREAMKMLSAAEDARSGLCLIISGTA